MKAAPAAHGVEVVLHHLGHGAASAQAILEAYHEASRRMAGTPGLLGNQLMTAVGAPDSFVVVSRWSDWDAFAAWEGSAGHKEQTAPLREFRDTSRERPFEIYRVLASH